MSKQKGDEAEQKAKSFLEDLGYVIIEQNFYAKKLGEIDIIATKDSNYHFCEVKSANDYEVAVNNITTAKLSKIKRSLSYYLQIKKLNVAYCVDVVIVTPTSIDLLENVTL
ncbi:MAG: YraN family protein [Poseidonibacter sp.]